MSTASLLDLVLLSKLSITFTSINYCILGTHRKENDRKSWVHWRVRMTHYQLGWWSQKLAWLTSFWFSKKSQLLGAFRSHFTTHPMSASCNGRSSTVRFAVVKFMGLAGNIGGHIVTPAVAGVLTAVGQPLESASRAMAITYRQRNVTRRFRRDALTHHHYHHHQLACVLRHFEESCAASTTNWGPGICCWRHGRSLEFHKTRGGGFHMGLETRFPKSCSVFVRASIKFLAFHERKISNKIQA